jgi:hypothetical protein
MRGELISHSDERWAAVLARTRHDVYHTPEYSKVAARYEDARATAYYLEFGDFACLVPLLVRSLPAELGVPADWTDATSPYGYPGPVFAGSPDTTTRRDMLRAMNNDCRDAGLISAFMRCHPLLPLDDEDADWPGAKRVHHGETVYIDLTHSPAILWRNMRENHRTQIARLIRSGFRIAFDQWQYFETFNHLYAETMERRAADPFYLFPAEYFRELRTALNDRLHLCCVLSPDGSAAAAGLFTEVDGTVQYHLGCSSSEHLPKAPSKLMFHGALNWAAERGNRLFHLGGGTGCAADSLFAFKAGFSRLRASFDTYRVVLDRERYSRLVDMANAMQPRTTRSNFFPEYRRGPGSSAQARCEPAVALRAV